MLAVLSPAKKLNYDPVEIDLPASLPEFQKEAVSLARTAKQLSLTGLRGLMDISQDLAKLNKERFKAFEPQSTQKNAKQAALAFDGDTYQGLQATNFSKADFDYAQDHLRILSGLYGLLKPLDLMQPYRLEMGSRLKTRRGSNLYAYWGNQLGKTLDAVSGGAPVINLASSEYFKAAKSQDMKSPVITCAFKEEKGNELKMVGFFAKNGFRSDLSDAQTFVFSRPATT